jgi:hypothetical protein
MATNETTDVTIDGIDPHDIELPEPLGERVKETFDLWTRPDTYGEWAQGIVDAFEADAQRSISTEDLCDTEDSPHSATLDGETTHYMCAQDPLVVGLLADEPVTVESTPPNRSDPIRIEFGPDGAIGVEPAGALFSFGIVADAEAPATISPQEIYQLVCPYGHAFPTDEAYQAWADEVDAVTDVLSVPAGIAVMAALIEAAGVEELT